MAWPPALLHVTIQPLCCSPIWIKYGQHESKTAGSWGQEGLFSSGLDFYAIFYNDNKTHNRYKVDIQLRLSI